MSNDLRLRNSELIVGEIYVIDKKYISSGTVKLLEKGLIYGIVECTETKVRWSTMLNRLSK